MKSLKYLTLFLAFSVIFASCKKDPDALVISTIEAAGTALDGSAVTKNLNESTSATSVPLNAVVTVTFDKAVDATTANENTVTIKNEAGTELTATVSSTGSSVTIDPTDDFERGTLYTLNLFGLKATDEGELASITRTFETEGRKPVIAPYTESQVAYWKFDGNTNEESGSFTTANEIAVSYTTDRFGQASSCLLFDGDETLVEVGKAASLVNTDDFTLSFWIKSDGSDKDANDNIRAQFVMGLAGWNGFQYEIFGNYGGCKLAASYELADGTGSAEDLWWSTAGNLGFEGWTFDQDVSGSGGLAGIIQDKWAHVVCTYNATTKIGSMYINGELRKSQDFNLYGDTHPKKGAVGLIYNGNPSPGDNLAFGFIQGSENPAIGDAWANPIGTPDNNHYKGLMDDVRIIHAAYSSADVKTLYDAEKP